MGTEALGKISCDLFCIHYGGTLLTHGSKAFFLSFYGCNYVPSVSMQNEEDMPDVRGTGIPRPPTEDDVFRNQEADEVMLPSSSGELQVCKGTGLFSVFHTCMIQFVRCVLD